MVRRKSTFYDWEMSIKRKIEKQFDDCNFPDFLKDSFWDNWKKNLPVTQRYFNQVLSGDMTFHFFIRKIGQILNIILDVINSVKCRKFKKNFFINEMWSFLENKKINTGFFYSNLNIDEWFREVISKVLDLSNTYGVDKEKFNSFVTRISTFKDLLKNKNIDYTEKYVSSSVIMEIKILIKKPVITRLMREFNNKLGLLKLD
jgi:hypothetical protein